MNESKFLILGGGMVAGYAAKQLVELGLQPGELPIVSADNSVTGQEFDGTEPILLDIPCMVRNRR